MIFEVIVDISNSEVDRVFDYIGDETIHVGCRVLVPFGNRKIEGFVIGQKEHTNYDADKLKSIIKRLDDFVTISPEMIELMHSMVARFNVRLIDALRLFLTAQMHIFIPAKCMLIFAYLRSQYIFVCFIALRQPSVCFAYRPGLCTILYSFLGEN